MILTPCWLAPHCSITLSSYYKTKKLSLLYFVISSINSWFSYFQNFYPPPLFLSDCETVVYTTICGGSKWCLMTCCKKVKHHNNQWVNTGECRLITSSEQFSLFHWHVINPSKRRPLQFLKSALLTLADFPLH